MNPDDDTITFIKPRFGKLRPATPLDNMKFMLEIGKALFELVDKEYKARPDPAIVENNILWAMEWFN